MFALCAADTGHFLSLPLYAAPVLRYNSTAIGWRPPDSTAIPEENREVPIMIYFQCDYATGAHPKVLQHLVDTNAEACPGYGEDAHCGRAREMLRALCQAPEAAVHFLVGGTQANLTVIAAALRPHQGVISALSGHISDHETGSIEATGHKVLTLPSADGKITAQQIDALCRAHYQDPAFEHKVQPAMVYLAHPTEFGAVYTRAELEEIRRAADHWQLTVYLDGARLAYGLAASDVTLPDLARLCDAFCFGGTKAGTLFGEAVVISQPALQRDFRYIMKQRGGMLSKGRLLGVQFEALLADGLYLEIGQKAVAQAQRLQKAFLDKGWSLLFPSPTNQQFPVQPDEALAVLNQKYVSEFWGKPDAGHTAVRFCTGWSTRDEDVDALIQDIAAL